MMHTYFISKIKQVWILTVTTLKSRVTYLPEPQIKALKGWRFIDIFV